MLAFICDFFNNVHLNFSFSLLATVFAMRATCVFLFFVCVYFSKLLFELWYW